MDSLPSKMEEADQHLDRLGGILRSLRAPPPDRSTPSNHVGRNRPAGQRHHLQLQEQHHHQQQQQQQQQDREQDEKRQFYASGSSRSRSASQSSQNEITTMLHASRRDQEARGGVVRHAPPTPRQYQRLGGSDEDLLTAATVPGPSAPSSTVPPVVRPGVADGETGRESDGDEVEAATKAKAPVSLLLLRQRAVRTWWRGLSCGICFAAGAWAREGHGVYGAVLALVAVCGETMLYVAA